LDIYVLFIHQFYKIIKFTGGAKVGMKWNRDKTEIKIEKEIYYKYPRRFA
jgi:hypothetical protein